MYIDVYLYLCIYNNTPRTYFPFHASLCITHLSGDCDSLFIALMARALRVKLSGTRVVLGARAIPWKAKARVPCYSDARRRGRTHVLPASLYGLPQYSLLSANLPGLMTTLFTPFY